MYRRMNALGLAWSAGIALLMMPGERARIVMAMVNGLGDLGWLYISYILLWGLTLIPALLLHKVLRESVWLLRQRDDLTRRGTSRRSGPAPQFSAPVLGAEKAVTSLDLTGQDTMLMFVRPEDGVQELDKQLRTSAYGLLHKASLYVVCSGSTEGCRQLLPEFQFSGNETIKVPVLLDEDGAIARAFQVNRTPVAYRLDSEARIVGFGEQRASSPIEYKGERRNVCYKN